MSVIETIVLSAKTDNFTHKMNEIHSKDQTILDRLSDLSITDDGLTQLLTRGFRRIRRDSLENLYEPIINNTKETNLTDFTQLSVISASTESFFKLQEQFRSIRSVRRNDLADIYEPNINTLPNPIMSETMNAVLSRMSATKITILLYYYFTFFYLLELTTIH